MGQWTRLFCGHREKKIKTEFGNLTSSSAADCQTLIGFAAWGGKQSNRCAGSTAPAAGDWQFKGRRESSEWNRRSGRRRGAFSGYEGICGHRGMLRLGRDQHWRWVRVTRNGKESWFLAYDFIFSGFNLSGELTNFPPVMFLCHFDST